MLISVECHVIVNFTDNKKNLHFQQDYEKKGLNHPLEGMNGLPQCYQICGSVTNTKIVYTIFHHV